MYRKVCLLLILSNGLVATRLTEQFGLAFGQSIGKRVGVCQKLSFTVLASDSFLKQSQAELDVIPEFESRYGCQVRLLRAKNAGQMLDYLERRGPGDRRIQAVLGIDHISWEFIKHHADTWASWKPQGYYDVPLQLRVANGFLPLDFSPVVFLRDTQEDKKGFPPLSDGGNIDSLTSLLEPSLRKKLVIEDPRTSNLGLLFLMYTYELLKTKSAGFWRAFRPQCLTLAPSWSHAYTLFLKKEAPYVWTYATSEVFHASSLEDLEKGGASVQLRYKPIDLGDDGAPLMVEGAVLISNSSQSCDEIRLGKSFLDFLSTKDVQKKLALRAWMLPAVQGVVLPPSYRALTPQRATKLVLMDRNKILRMLVEWREALISF